LHKRVSHHAGIVYASSDPDFAGEAGRIAAALGGLADVSGMLIRVYLPHQPPMP
jgi:hypothetical protein